ncbi:hypothetical protein [Mycobacterium intermedium]|uniref:hypothetical protein n=1 Tax=Mycobacterium intermedium TaxID=28445 RepID=UPI0021F2B7A3|nr:hypothetical protein [Mycobacterium intermedium]
MGIGNVSPHITPTDPLTQFGGVGIANHGINNVGIGNVGANNSGLPLGPLGLLGIGNNGTFNQGFFNTGNHNLGAFLHGDNLIGVGMRIWAKPRRATPISAILTWPLQISSDHRWTVWREPLIVQP